MYDNRRVRVDEEPEGPDLVHLLTASESTGEEKEIIRALAATAVHTRSMINALEAIEAHTLASAAAIAEAQTIRSGTAKAAEREMPLRSIAAEFATALRVSDRTMQSRMKSAQDMTMRFPETYAAWADGRITRRHAAVIHEAGMLIDDVDARGDYERVAVRAAEHDTPGRLGPIVKLLAARFDTQSIDERHLRARAQRHVRVTDLGDGMAELLAVLPATLARGIEDRLTEQAKAIIRARSVTPTPEPAAVDPESFVELTADEPAAVEDSAPDTRSIDEVRADLFADLLLCGAPAVPHDGPGDGLGAIKATVRITVPVLTAAGVGTDPAILTPYGPIDTDTARTLLGDANAWERVMTSPVTGAVLAVDRYEPNADLTRYLDARDEHCRFPGCRMPARRCDRDHTKEAAREGPTCACNLEHLCEGHHMLRHHTAWSVGQLGGGLLEWTSPLGHVYIDRPEAIVRFVPDDDDVPGFEPLPGDPADGGPQVSFPAPTDDCPHTLTRRNPLLDPWLIAHEGPPAPF